MGHKVYISFKWEDESYKSEIQGWSHIDYVDRSLDTPIDSTDEDYILRKIRDEYLSDSTVTISLIGAFSAENRGAWEQRFIKRELQASLYNGGGNSKSGILGVVLPDMETEVFRGSSLCLVCGDTHNTVGINDSTTVKEFSYNFYIPNEKCSWSEEDRYCVLASWDDFKASPNGWIDKAFAKRSAPIASKTRVRPWA